MEKTKQTSAKNKKLTSRTAKAVQTGGGNTSKPPKVLVSINLAHASWRDFFSGILRYADETANWDVRIAHEPGDLSAAQIKAAEREGYAGIILASSGTIDFKRLNRSSVPLAACGSYPKIMCRKRNVLYMCLDNKALGAVGARHLLACGRHAVYGFVRSRFDMDWSLHRQAAFAKTVRAAGGTVKCYALPRGAAQEKDLPELRKWLLSLPRPAAVMADCDRRAAQVIAACRDGGLDIPHDIAVLGVDDDEFYALHTRPPLSSVAPGHLEAGYRIAEELDQLIKAEKSTSRPKRIVIHPKGVVARESTRPISSAAALVRRAKEFIEANAIYRLRVIDVARHLGCSRRIAELRFRQHEKITIARYISDCRLEEARQRLATSTATVAEISAECGIKTPSHLSNLFRRKFGMSINDFRNSAHAKY